MYYIYDSRVERGSGSMYIPQLQVNLDNIFFKVIAPVGHRHLRYFIKCKSNIKNLKTQVKKLEEAKERVQHAVDAANRNGEEIEADVLSWLSGVDNITKEAGKFLEEGQAMMMGAERWYPNLKSRYQLSKKATKMAQVVVAEIPSEGKFNQVAYRPAPQGLTTVASSAFIAFESRTLTLNEIMEALKDPNINMIGVYGMSGVGKTALRKEVAIQANEKKLFDVTITVSVKQNPDPKRIQGEMADKLGLKFNEETVGGRADRLCFRIKKEEKILVILDDLWVKLDLEEVGVPFGDAHKGCKILLTSRTRDVLTVEMGTQKHFELVALSKKEAWSLFEKVALAGDEVRDINLETVAIEVANRCAGLPVIIVTVARALKGKDLSVWKEKLKDLEKIDNNEGMEAKYKVYSALELSYNHLEGDEVKSVFLLCGLLPKYDIAIDYLSLCAMALGLFKCVDTLEEAKNRVHKWIDVLKGQCLLLDGETNKQVKMHDFVHDFAVSVSSRDRHVYVNDLPEKDMLEKCTMISFPSKEIRELPEGLECPKLELIKLENTNGRMKIPETFFKGMRNLRLMDFSRMHFISLPSLHFLRNLKMLRLHRCMFRDIVVVGELKRLEILLLTECDILELPKEIGKLTCLRLLNLTGSSKLEVIPAGVISSLKNLEELYMGNSFAQWEVEELNCERGNASLHELKHLSKLTNLEVYIPDAKAFPKDLLFNKLERYVILIGGWLDLNNHMDETLRTLKLKLNPSLQLEDGIKMLLKKAESVYLDELNGVKSIMYELDDEGYKQLKHLCVQNNAWIQYIINSREQVDPCITFPVLESIFLRSLSNLEKICHGQLPEESFRNLSIVKVELCHRLKYLSSLSAVPGGFVQLQELEINECRIMSVVFAEEREDQTDSAMADVIKFPELRSLTMQDLPKLTDFCSHIETPSTSSRPLFNQKVSFPKLEALILSSINLESIWDENIQTSCSIGFQNLTRLIVQSCGSLKYLLSFSNAKSLLQLNYLKICRCEVMEEVVVKNELGDEEGRLNKMFPKLEYLKLKDLPNLSRFSDGFLIEFQIKDLWIENCPKLKTFISKSLSTNENTVGNEIEELNSEENLHAIASKQPLFNELAAFPNLEAMIISKMDNLEMIWDNQLTHECSFCNLRFMSVTNCEKLPAIFPFNMLRGLQNIETLEVRNCHSLEEISTCPANDLKEKLDEIAFNFKLEYLRLSNLQKLKHLWHDNFPISHTFKNLRLIKVEECVSLKHLIPASMVGDLVKSDNEGEAEEEIAFNQLKYLKLRSLSNLTSFHSKKYNFKLPSLEEVVVEQCPNVNIPSLGLLSPRIERVTLTKGDEMHGQISESDGQGAKTNSAATIIQRRFRSYTKRKDFNLVRTGVIILQSLWRVKLAIRQFELLRSEKAALEIQKNKFRYQERINNQERTYKAENAKVERNVKEATTHSSQVNSRSTKTLSKGTLKSYIDEGKEEVTLETSKLSQKQLITESSNEKSPKSSTPSANESVKPSPPGTGATDSNVPLSDIKEDDMEVFYASVGAKSESCQCQPTSMDDTAHAQCNKSKPDQADIDNALKVVNNVLETHFSLACDSGCSNSFKFALELLCGLDEHDGISIGNGMKPLVLQLSKDFEMMTKRFDWANETIERHNKLIQSKAEIESQLIENKDKFLKLSSVESEVEGYIKKLQQQINSLTEQRNLAKQEKKATFLDGKKLKDKLNEDVQKAGNVEKEKEIAEWTKEEIEEKWSGFTEQFLTLMQIAKP